MNSPAPFIPFSASVATRLQNRSTLLALAVLLVFGIAFCDWRVTTPVPIGFLYLVPMFLFGRAVGAPLIVLIALACTAMAEAYDGFPFLWPVGLSRVLLYFAAFATTGLLVRVQHRSSTLLRSHVAQLEAQQLALINAEQQLQALIESSPAAFLTADETGRILLANEAACRVFEIKSASLQEVLIGTFLPALAHLDMIGSGRPRYRAVLRTRGVRASQESFNAEICFSTYPTAEGTRLTAMILDVSEELRDSEEASLRQLLAGSRLAAGAMSHEIRNTCAAISVVYRNLLQTAELEPSDDARSLGNLIGILEGLAAFELDSVAPQCSPTNLPQVIDDLRIMLVPTLHQAQIASEWTYAEDLPLVWAERSQLMQILLNLCHNSVRALQGQARPWLSLTVVYRETRVLVELSDNGGGVANPKKLFQPFQDGAAATGLGLFLSRAFVRNAGGDLRYKLLQQGSCFVIELLPIVGGSNG